MGLGLFLSGGAALAQQPVATTPSTSKPVGGGDAGPTSVAMTNAGPPVRQTGGQNVGSRLDSESDLYAIQLEVPSLQRVTRRESERDLQERIRQEARNRSSIDRIEFPAEPPISTEAYTARQFSPMTRGVEPHYVCHGRLHFEDRNSERYGWDLGPIQPLVSSGIFLWDVVALPYHAGTDICRHYECSSGYCLPGDPVPYLLYPPRLSVTGAILQGGAIVSLVSFFPS